VCENFTGGKVGTLRKAPFRRTVSISKKKNNCTEGGGQEDRPYPKEKTKRKKPSGNRDSLPSGTHAVAGAGGVLRGRTDRGGSRRPKRPKTTRAKSAERPTPPYYCEGRDKLERKPIREKQARRMNILEWEGKDLGRIEAGRAHVARWGGRKTKKEQNKPGFNRTNEGRSKNHR